MYENLNYYVFVAVVIEQMWMSDWEVVEQSVLRWRAEQVVGGPREHLVLVAVQVSSDVRHFSMWTVRNQSH